LPQPGRASPGAPLAPHPGPGRPPTRRLVHLVLCGAPVACGFGRRGRKKSVDFFGVDFAVARSTLFTSISSRWGHIRQFLPTGEKLPDVFQEAGRGPLEARRQRPAPRTRRDSAAAKLHGMANKPRSRARGGAARFDGVEPGPTSPPPSRLPAPTRRGHQPGADVKPPGPACPPCPSARARRRPETRSVTREVRAREPPRRCFQQGRKPEARSPRGVKTAGVSGAHCICACARRVGAPRGAAVVASAPVRWRPRTPLCAARAPHSRRARRNRPNSRASSSD
jgi:hypothetical protein